jgi:hypothetical protein
MTQTTFHCTLAYITSSGISRSLRESLSAYSLPYFCYTLKFPNIYFVYMKSRIGKKSLFDFLNKNKLVRCECCIHAGAYWCFLSAKGFKSAIRCCPNPPENFTGFSGIYSHFLLSYFYLLEGSKIFFMRSKYFIWIHHDPSHL